MRRPLILASLVLSASVLAAQARPVDTQASHVTVKVYRAGVFGGLGDNHEIAAPIAQGTLDESAHKVTLRFDARQMRVLDPNLSPDKRAQVQERMLGPDVLDVDRFPEIVFESTVIREQPGGVLAVNGTLRLHGQTHPVSGTASSSSDGFRGSFKVKQHDFGIKPISLAGGTIKVKDEVSIDFQIRPVTQK